MHTPDKRRRWMRSIVLMAVTAVFVAPAAVWAADAFTDVPDSNVFHDDIAWLADADVTKGCNPPDNTRFCPDTEVTRGQMAAFMKRLAENQVVDAGSLAGAGPEAYQTIVTGTGPTPSAVLTSGTNQTLVEHTFEVPVDGFAAITAPASYFESDDGEIILQWLQLDDTTCNNGPAADDIAAGHASAVTQRTTLTLAATIPLSAGEHTVTLCGREFAGAFDPVVYGAAIQIVFSPSGSTS